MSPRRWLCLSIVLLIAPVACRGPVDKCFPGDVQTILNAPDTFEFMTIDPSRENIDPKRPGTMHGYAILGRTMITDPATQKRLVADLYDAVSHDNAAAAACFDPRHAIRASRQGQVVDVIVCFECLGLEVYSGDKHTGSRINADARADFENVALQAHLPVATAPGE